MRLELYRESGFQKNNLDSEALAQYKMSKTYFLVPTRDTPPSGPIFLGSIITSPRSPELSINSKKSALLSTLEVQETTLKDSSRHLSLGSKGKTGIWAEFIGGMGIGGELSTTWENTSTSTYKFAELVTRTISPSLGEIQAIFQGQDVQSCIKDSRFRDNLYIITGVKIAKGANVVIEKVRARGGNLNFGVDATPLGVPIKVGPDIEVSKEAGQGLEERHEDAFVFAYRLREIKYRRKVVEKQTEYLKGDLMGVGPGEEKKGAVDDLMELVDGDDEAELLKFDERDVKGGDFDADETAAVDDDGEEVIVIRFDDDDED